GLRELAMNVCNLTPDERIEVPRGFLGTGEGLLVDALSVVIVPEVVARHREVQCSLCVTWVQGECLFEGDFSFLELPAVMMYDAQHVVDVRESLVFLDDLLQVVFRLIEFALLVVLAAKRKELFGALFHISCSSVKRRLGDGVKGTSLLWISST